MRLFKNKKGHSGNTHMLIGLAVLAVLYFLNQKYSFFALTIQDIIFSILITLFFSRLPDQDIEGSKINDMVNLILVVVIIWALLTSNVLYGIIAALYIAFLQFINHRGIVHSLGMALIMSAPLYFIKPLYFVVGVVAYVGHLVSENELNIWKEKDWKLFK